MERERRPVLNRGGSETSTQHVARIRGPLAAPVPPSTREHQAIAALALVAFALNLNTSVLGALLPFVPGELSNRATWLLAAAGFGSAIGALLMPAAAARMGLRPVLLASLAAFGVVSALHLLPLGVWPFLVVRALSGVAVGTAYAAASSLVTEAVPYARRGAAMGWFTAGMFLAIPVGMPIAVLCADAGGWQWIFGVQAVLAVGGVMAAARSVPATAGRLAPMRYLPVLRNGAAMAGLLATMLHVGSFFTTVQLATRWLADTGRVPAEDQMWLWIGLGAVSVVGSGLLGRLSDAFGKRNFVLATSAVLVGCFLFLTREPTGAVLAWVGAGLALTAAARTGPLQALVSGVVVKDEVASLMALRGFAMQVGVGAFALAATPLSADLGFRGVLWLGAGCQAASYLVIRLWGREGR